MKKCNKDFIPVCDFCINYKDYSKQNNGEFEGVGRCLIDDKEVIASDFCVINFHCFNVKD